MTIVTLTAITAIILVSSLLVIAVVVSERGQTRKERAKAEGFEAILRETIHSSLTSDELNAYERRTYVLGLCERTEAAPYVNGGF